MPESVFIKEMFDAREAKEGCVVRRQLKDVKELGGGLDKLEVAVRARGFHLLITGDQAVVLCNKGHFQVVC